MYNHRCWRQFNADQIIYIANCVFGQRKACPCSWNLRWILSIVKLEMMSMFVMFSSIMAKMALIETCPRDFIYLETNLYPSFYCKGLNITINDSNFPSINYFHKIDKNELIFLYTTNSGTWLYCTLVLFTCTLYMYRCNWSRDFCLTIILVAMLKCLD